MSACFYSSLPSGEYSNASIVVAFSNIPTSGEMSSSIKNSYLPTFLQDKFNFLAVFLSKL